MNSMLLALLLAAPPAEAECPVRIVLPAKSFHSAVEAKARLASETAEQIHLPSWLPGGFRIETAASTSLDDPAAGPTASDTRADSIHPLRSERFDLEHPTLLGVHWKDVGVPVSTGSFTVPAGTYRMKLTFAVVAPREQRGPLVHLCTIYSSSFVLETDSGWTEFQ